MSRRTCRDWYVKPLRPVDWIARAQAKAKRKLRSISWLASGDAMHVRIQFVQSCRKPAVRKLTGLRGSDIVDIRPYDEVDVDERRFMEAPEQRALTQVHNFTDRFKRWVHTTDMTDVQTGDSRRWLLTYYARGEPITRDRDLPDGLRAKVDTIWSTSRAPMYYVYMCFATKTRGAALVKASTTHAVVYIMRYIQCPPYAILNTQGPDHSCIPQELAQRIQPSPIYGYYAVCKIVDAKREMHPAMHILREDRRGRSALFREWSRMGTQSDNPADTDIFELVPETALSATRLKLFERSHQDPLIVSARISARFEAIRQATEMLRSCLGTDRIDPRATMAIAAAENALQEFKTGVFVPAGRQPPPDDPWPEDMSTDAANARGCHWFVSYKGYDLGPVNSNDLAPARITHLWNTATVGADGTQSRHAYIRTHSRISQHRLKMLLEPFDPFRIAAATQATAATDICFRTLYSHQMTANDFFETWHSDGDSGVRLPAICVHSTFYDGLMDDARKLVEQLPLLRKALADIRLKVLVPPPDVLTEQRARKTLRELLGEVRQRIRAAPAPL